VRKSRRTAGRNELVAENGSMGIRAMQTGALTRVVEFCYN
jgi:hypothetical protein